MITSLLRLPSLPPPLLRTLTSCLLSHTITHTSHSRTLLSCLPYVMTDLTSVSLSRDAIFIVSGVL